MRFSSPDQQYGDSIRRQTALAAAYALEFGLNLDDQLTYQDFGISSFRGQNAASGRLGDFLAAISSGLVPAGSVLLVENLDRLSRESALNAQNLLTQIVLAGVSIVTLSDRRTYSIEELKRDPMGLIFALINFIRANEESEIKSSRAKANWVAKRATVLTQPLTARCPSWLKLDKDRRRFRQIPERVAIVQLIFQLADEGSTLSQVAITLNQRGMRTWRTKSLWNRNSVGNIICFSAVIGTYVPHYHHYEDGCTRRRPLKPVPDYYPAIVSAEQFDRVQAIRLAAYTSGRSAVGYLLQHLAVCEICGRFMKIVLRAEHGSSMVCSAALAGTETHYSEILYLPIDRALRLGLPRILRDYGRLDEEWGSNHRLRAAQNVLDRARRARSGDLHVKPNSHLQALKAAENEMREAVASYESRPLGPLRRKIEIALECLAETDFGPVEARLINTALKAVFTKALIDITGGFIELHQQDGAIQRVAYQSITRK
ncbi:hypothetical protein ASG11_09975 [Sphingomonas sp. Leaf357]|nr:hypothetical protein ASG11_09975 [Sphingomonas sp. Leaf357]